MCISSNLSTLKQSFYHIHIKHTKASTYHVQLQGALEPSIFFLWFVGNLWLGLIINKFILLFYLVYGVPSLPLTLQVCDSWLTLKVISYFKML